MQIKPTLYFSPGACSLAPHIVLEEIGLPFELSHSSTSDGSTHTPEYLRMNPKGRVPVLVTGNSVLTEAPAILLHLAISNPDQKLLSGIPDGLVRSIEWFNWLSGTVHAVAIRQVWRPESFTDTRAQHEDIVAKGKKNCPKCNAPVCMCESIMEEVPIPKMKNPSNQEKCQFCGEMKDRDEEIMDGVCWDCRRLKS